MRARLASIAVLLLHLPLSSGCTIWDELEASSELMDSMTKEVEKPADPASPDAPPADPLHASKQWWKSAQSISSNELDSSIVNCRLADGRKQFMKRPQCMARNGQPL